ncbi:hypothetical protein Ahia01_000856700 [Argonauta hians]
MSTCKRNTTASDSECPVLKALLDVISLPEANIQESLRETDSRETHSSPSRHFSQEAHALEQFSRKYKNCRNFSHLSKHIDVIFTALVSNRLCNRKWQQLVPVDNLLRVLVLLRIVMRDNSYGLRFSNLNGIPTSAEILKDYINIYLEYGETPYVREILMQLTNIFYKLSACTDQRKWLLAADVHQSLVLLASFPDLQLVHCSLYCLMMLTKRYEPLFIYTQLYLYIYVPH